MSDKKHAFDDRKAAQQTSFRQHIRAKLRRRQKAIQEEDDTIFWGLGLFGVVGWAVAIPTLLGIALGVWLDQNWPSRISWTLTFLFLGVVLGCLNAWYWIEQSHPDD